MIEIYYDGHGDLNSSNYQTQKLFAHEPVRTLGLAASRGNYLSCVSIQDYHLNTFTVLSPYATTIKIDRANNKVELDGDNNVASLKFYEDGVTELQLHPQYIFRAEESVIVQLLPPLLTPPRVDFFIPAGEYDISKWIRPVQMPMIIAPDVTEIKIKENEPLFSLRFITKNNQPVKLVRKSLTDDELKLANACMNVTNVKLGTPLAKLYQYFDIFKGSFANKKGKCPFH